MTRPTNAVDICRTATAIHMTRNAQGAPTLYWWRGDDVIHNEPFHCDGEAIEALILIDEGY